MALGALAAIPVMILFLALLGANPAKPSRSVTRTPQPSTAQVTLIQADDERVRTETAGVAPPLGSRSGSTEVRMIVSPARDE